MTDRRAHPTFSVLMPTFEQAAFIRRALESLLAQHFDDWEALVVDDGSTDKTASRCAPICVIPVFGTSGGRPIAASARR